VSYADFYPKISKYFKEFLGFIGTPYPEGCTQKYGETAWLF